MRVWLAHSHDRGCCCHAGNPCSCTLLQAARQASLVKENANGVSKNSDGAGDKKGAHNKRRGRGGTAPPPVDEDPLGLTLLEKDPLPEAARFVALLSAHAAAHVETHLLAFDVAVKRGKFLLAARAVIRYVCMLMCVLVLGRGGGELFACLRVCW